MAMAMRNTPRLTLEGAQAVLAAAQKRAGELNVPMNIAVVDDGGHLMAFARMDGAKPSSIEIAIDKARAAALRRQNPAARAASRSTRILSLGLSIGSRASRFRFAAVCLSMVDGICVGGIGVSAGTEDEDTEVARAGVAAFVKA